MRAKSRSGLGSRSLGSRGLGSLNKESPRVIERMKMDKDEIQMFKELIDKKYERADKPKEDKDQRDAYQKASLEELLKEEEKEGIDPKLIMGMGAVSFCFNPGDNDSSRIWDRDRSCIWDVNIFNVCYDYFPA